jgi:hypothetical protein
MPTDIELIELFRCAPDGVAAAIGDASAEETRFSPAPGKWTIREIVAHLADTEIVGGMRLRQMIGEESPNLAVFNQDAWAKAFAYNEVDVAASLGLLRTLRSINADMLARAADITSGGAFDRAGSHPERGVLTVRDWVERFTKHVDRHAQQIVNIRAVWKASKPAGNA